MELPDEDDQFELTDEDKKFIRDRAKRAERKARQRFHRVVEVAEQAGAEAEAKATRWSRRKGYSPERTKDITREANREAQELIWIREYLRIDEDLIYRAFREQHEEIFVEEAIERAGEEAAREVGWDSSEWWECGFYEKDDEDDESA